MIDLIHLDLTCSRLKVGLRRVLPHLMIFEVKDLRPPHVENLLDLHSV